MNEVERLRRDIAKAIGISELPDILMALGQMAGWVIAEYIRPELHEEARDIVASQVILGAEFHGTGTLDIVSH